MPDWAWAVIIAIVTSATVAAIQNREHVARTLAAWLLEWAEAVKFRGELAQKRKEERAQQNRMD